MRDVARIELYQPGSVIIEPVDLFDIKYIFLYNVTSIDHRAQTVSFTVKYCNLYPHRTGWENQSPFTASFKQLRNCTIWCQGARFCSDQELTELLLKL